MLRSDAQKSAKKVTFTA